MKFSIVLLAASMLQAQDKKTGIYLECYTKVDCKLINFVQEAIESGKGAECENKGAVADTTKCQLVSYGLSKDRAELAWKALPYNIQCAPKPDTEFKTCAVGCTKQKDRDTCLESCVLPLKVKSEECLSKLAGTSTENASNNAKCVMGCDKNSYSEIFECAYNCHKDVIDTLANKDDGSKDSDKSDEDSDHKSTGGASKTNHSGSQTKPAGEASNSTSSGSQTKPTGSSQSRTGSSGQSSAYLTTQGSSLAKVSLAILIANLFI